MRVTCLILMVFVIISCAKDGDKAIKLKPDAKKLDTSFLELGEIGKIEAQSTLQDDATYIHKLEDNQEIEFINQQGLTRISNFDYSVLSDGDIIVGNTNDRYLLKYEEKNQPQNTHQTGIVLRQASISELTRDNESALAINFTPKLELEASEARSFDKIGDRNKNLPQSNSSTVPMNLQALSKEDKNKDPNPDKLNILNFENYELVNYTGQAQGSSHGFIPGDKTRFKLHTSDNVKVTINKGRLELIPSFKGDYEFNGIRDINLESNFNSLVRYKFEVTVETTGPVAGEVSFPLFKSLTFPVRVPGAVPVYVDIEINFPAGIKLGTNKPGKMSFMVESEYALSAKTSYNSQTGKTITSHYDFVVNNRKFEKIDSEGDYLFELFFEPSIRTKFYRVLGPYAYINANVQADIKFPLRQTEEDLFLNFSGGVGMTFDEPIFSKTLVDVKSPTLFSLSKGWDLVGPKQQNVSRTNQVAQMIQMDIGALDSENKVTLKLRPNSLSALGKVSIYEQPSFGKLVLSANFTDTGIVDYYPPQVVEGQDSFLIQFVDRGVISKPTRILLELSQQAKDQAKKGPLNILPNYKDGYLFDDSNAMVVPSHIYEESDNRPKRDPKKTPFVGTALHDYLGAIELTDYNCYGEGAPQSYKMDLYANLSPLGKLSFNLKRSSSFDPDIQKKLDNLFLNKLQMDFFNTHELEELFFLNYLREFITLFVQNVFADGPPYEFMTSYDFWTERGVLSFYRNYFNYEKSVKDFSELKRGQIRKLEKTSEHLHPYLKNKKLYEFFVEDYRKGLTSLKSLRAEEFCSESFWDSFNPTLAQ